jgi:hypothetical protein
MLDIATGQVIRTIELGGSGQAYPVLADSNSVVVVDEARFVQALLA